MGVHGLWELLAPVGRRVSVELLGNKKLAIDASIWIVQFLKAMRDDRGEVMRNAHLLGFFRRICKLLFLRVKPVFVFDGGTPFLKMRTVIARRRQRELAQSKIRKTAEKLLLNHLKAKKLEELVREEEGNGRPSDQPKENKERASSSSQTNAAPENLDALLAASLANDQWENDDPKDLDSGYEEHQHILPLVNGKVDPEVLASLPPSMQLQLFDEMREQLVAENRQKFEKVAKAPSSFSKLQIEAYLKTVAFRRDIDLVQKAAANIIKDGVPTVRIASEANREYIFSTETGKKNLPERVEERSPGVIVNDDTKERGAAAKSTVQTYLDGKARKRVSRVRGMGVRMTRDLQWNLYLMKDKEAQNKEDAAEDESDAFEKLVSEDRIADTGAEEFDLEQTRNMEISFVDNGSLKSDELFTDLVSDPQQDDIDWEEDGDEEPAKPDDRPQQINDENTGTGMAGMQVCFVDDGTLQLDETFDMLDPQQDDEDIEWEEDSHQMSKLLAISGPDAQDLPERIVKSSCNILPEDEDGNKLESTDQAQADGIAPKVAPQIDETVAQVAKVAPKVDGSASATGPTEDAHRVSDSDLLSGPAENKQSQQLDNGVHDIEWEEDAQKDSLPVNIFQDKQEKMDHGNNEHKKMTGVSEEQAQIEEAIRRSLVDYGPAKAFKPLIIKETDAEERDKVQVQEQSELLRKGKAIVDESSNVDISGREANRAEEIHKQANPTHAVSEKEDTGKTSFVTDEEERFLEAEDRAVRQARFNEERERLLQEETTLREEQKKNERNAESVTSEMFSECQELLQLFGLPYVVAPMEAEAQCAFMDAENLVDGVVTDDSDVFLFGGRSVYKNIFDGHKYVETYYMKDAESDLGLDREKLVRMAMLLGSDYTEGISGIGIVNAIEVVNAFPEEDGLQQLRDWIDSPDVMIFDNVEGRPRKTSKKSEENANEDGLGVDKKKQQFMRKHRAVSKNWTVPSSFPSNAVIEAYQSPQVDKSKETFEWGRPDLDMLRKFCFDRFGWTKEKADELLLPVLKEYDKRETQLRIDAFFSFNERFAKIRSSRIQKAVSGITGQTLPEMVYGNVPAKRKPRKRKPSDGKSSQEPRKRKATGLKRSDAAKTTRKRGRRSANNAGSEAPEGETTEQTPEEGREVGDAKQFVPPGLDVPVAEAAEISSRPTGSFSLDDMEDRTASGIPETTSGGGGGFIVDDREFVFSETGAHQDFSPREEDVAALFEAEEMATMRQGGGFIVESPGEDRSGAPEDEEVLRRQEKSLDVEDNGSFLDGRGAHDVLRGDDTRQEKSLDVEENGSLLDHGGAPEDEALLHKIGEGRRDPSLVAIPNFRRKRKLV